MTAGKASLGIIIATLFIDIAGIGLVIPVLPKLVESLAGGDTAAAAKSYGWLVAAYAGMQFVCGPVLGALSDRLGRRPVILVSMSGLGLAYVGLALAPTIGWLFAARLFAGMLAATYTVASAYIADISPPEKRAQAFGLVGAAFGLGFIAGPLIGGWLGEIGPRAPFVAAACLSFVNVALGFFLLRESLAPELRRPFRLRDANPIRAFAIAFRYPVVRTLLAALVLANLANRMMEANWVLYTGYRFQWGPAEVGMSLAFVGLMTAFVQGGLIRRLVPRFGEWRLVTVGLASGSVAFLLWGFADAAWMMYAITLVYALGYGPTGPSAQALATRAVPVDEQGVLQGALGGVLTATGAIGPLAGGYVFAAFIAPNAPLPLPGAAFLLGAVLFALALLVLMAGRRRIAAAAAVRASSEADGAGTAGRRARAAAEG